MMNIFLISPDISLNMSRTGLKKAFDLVFGKNYIIESINSTIIILLY